MSENIISAKELLALQQQQQQLVILDCRFALSDPQWGERCYREAHISGASYLHLDSDLSGQKQQHGGRHPLPAIDDIAAKFDKLGVGPNTLVVAYDDQRFAFASRCWWLLRYLGHDNVKVLNGGYSGWQQLDYPVDNKTPMPINKARQGPTYFCAKLNSQWLADINDIRQRDKKTVLIDSREAVRYQGIEEPIDPVAGHIEGAVNYPWQGVSDQQSQFLTETMQPRWKELLKAKELMVYCGSGVTACVNLLSLAEAGREDAKLYAGSWSDWCSYLPKA